MYAPAHACIHWQKRTIVNDVHEALHCRHGSHFVYAHCSTNAGTSSKALPSVASKLIQGGDHAIQLSVNSSVADLKQDIVIKKGNTVFLDGSARTLRIGLFQIRVEAGARLCLFNLHLVGSGTYSKNAILVGKGGQDLPTLAPVDPPVTEGDMYMPTIVPSRMLLPCHDPCIDT